MKHQHGRNFDAFARATQQPAGEYSFCIIVAMPVFIVPCTFATFALVVLEILPGIDHFSHPIDEFTNISHTAFHYYLQEQ